MGFFILCLQSSDVLFDLSSVFPGLPVRQYHNYDDVIKWKHFPRYWPYVRGIHRSPVNSPHKRPVTRSLDVFFDLRLNKRLRKQSRGCWFETLSCPLWRHCNVAQVAVLLEARWVELIRRDTIKHVICRDTWVALKFPVINVLCYVFMCRFILLFYVLMLFVRNDE